MPLTCSQRELVLAQLLAPGKPHLNIGLYWPFVGQIDPERFTAAVADASARCDGLRMILTSRDGLAEQRVVADRSVPLECFECDSVAEAMRWGTEYLRRPYELFESLLYRFGIAHVRGARTYMFVGCHHAMGDAWSLQLALQRAAESYNARLSGEVLADPPQFRECLAKEDRYRCSSAHARDREYWESRLSPPPPMPLAPHRGAGSPRFGLPDHHVALDLEPELYERLTERSQAVGASETSGLIAALYAFLCRRFGLEDLTICAALLNRPTARDRDIIGPLAGRAFLRLRGGAGHSFGELIRRASDETRQVYRHHRFPLSDLGDILGGPYSREWPRVASVTFSMIPYTEAAISFGDARPSAAPDRIHSGHEPSPMHVSLRRPSDRPAPVLDVCCNSHWIDRACALELPGRFVTFLDNLVRSRSATAAAVSMLTGQERERIVESWNRTDVARADRLLFHQSVSRQAALTPRAVALELEGEALTYAQLDHRSNQLARYLRRASIGAGMLVAAYLRRGIDSVIAVLAILKAGAAYLPLDVDLPVGRLEHLLEDARVDLVLTHAALPDSPVRFPGRVIGLQSEAEGIARESTNAPEPLADASEQLAYVIYTSGSTGSPKGVMVRHGGLRNLAQAQAAALGIRPGDRVLQFARLSFDASIWEIGMALCTGATLCLMRSAADLARVMSERKITVATLPPSALTLLEGVSLPELRMLILAGEPCPRALIANWLDRCEVINAYGPTEITVCASFHRCRPEEAPPIGRPLDNTRMYVLDEELEPVPSGVTGELYIAGEGLARGYRERPALTAQRFIASPFVHGQRMYRTGDLARYREDGCLEFVGRSDHQVKVRGHRIEPEEVEAALIGHPAVRQAVVVAGARPGNGEMRLSAYVVPSGGKELTAPQLRDYVRERLPEYMIPDAIVLIERVPLTENGKIDRKALAALEPLRAGPEHSAPRTPTERMLADLWREVLGEDQVSIDASFFDIGGSSLSLIKVRTLLAERAGRHLEITDFFAFPTIRRLAQRLDAGDSGTDSMERLAAAGRLRIEQAVRHGRARVARGSVPDGAIDERR